MAGRKAITIIVALLMVMAITIAVALSAFTFLQKTQHTAQGATETGMSNLLQRWTTCGKLVSIDYNKATKMADMVLRNCGFREIALGNDNLQLIFKTPAESCVFSLNSANCPNCVGKLGVGAFTALQINASAIYCASTLADVLDAVTSQSVDVTLSDQSTSFIAATTFIPAKIVTCRIDLVNVSTQNASVYCTSYNVTNRGNVNDTILLTVTAIDASGFVRSGNAYEGGPISLTCPGPAITKVTLAPGQTQGLALNKSCQGNANPCSQTGVIQLTATSTNCQSVYAYSTEGVNGLPCCPMP
jgi:hypothetical protein